MKHKKNVDVAEIVCHCAKMNEATEGTCFIFFFEYPRAFLRYCMTCFTFLIVALTVFIELIKLYEMIRKIIFRARLLSVNIWESGTCKKRKHSLSWFHLFSTEVCTVPRKSPFIGVGILCSLDSNAAASITAVLSTYRLDQEMGRVTPKTSMRLREPRATWAPSEDIASDQSTTLH